MSEIINNVPKIYGAICNVMSEVGAIGKNKQSQQNYKYRGVDDVMNALQPIMIKHKLFAIPEIIEERREDRVTGKGTSMIYTVLKVRYTFYTEDGSNVSAIVVGEGMDTGDKSANKAMSIAFKYACFQVFCIPTEEMTDPDAETPPESKPAPVQQAPVPITPKGKSYILAELKKLTNNDEEQKVIMAQAFRSRNITGISKLFESDVDNFVNEIQAIHRAIPTAVTA